MKALYLVLFLLVVMLLPTSVMASDGTQVGGLTPEQVNVLAGIIAAIAPFVWNFIKNRLGLVDTAAFWLVFALSALAAVITGVSLGLVKVPDWTGDPVSVIEQVIVMLSVFWGIAQTLFKLFLASRPVLRL